jgi:hypothetical protein
LFLDSYLDCHPFFQESGRTFFMLYIPYIGLLEAPLDKPEKEKEEPSE